MTQERTPDEKETTNRTDNSIEKPVRPGRVAAQNADNNLRRFIVEDECRVNITLGCKAI